jgi:hypothetical protein
MEYESDAIVLMEKLKLKTKILKRFVHCHVFAQSPSGHHLRENTPSSLYTAPDLCKNVSLAVLFGCNVLRVSCPSASLLHKSHGNWPGELEQMN